ncbi:MAG TPA: extracellular solute-binding protein [Rectinemataceae bacterium]|nr:extracellular solute-binding protein [Rectinemataceae bacterium]
MTRPTPPGQRFRSVFLSIGLAFAILSSAAAFELRLNGVPRSLPADARLRELSYLIPAKGSTERGLSVSELLPPLIEAWKIDCAGSGGARTWTGEDLADRLSGFYIVESGSGSWDLLAPDAKVASVSSISVAGDAAQERDLEVWLSWEGVPELKAEIQHWATLSGVRVRTVDVPDTRSKLLAVQRGGGRMPDLLMIQSDNVPDLVEAQALQPLDRIDASHVVKKGADAFSANGRRWAMPFYFDAQLVFYNKKMVPAQPSLAWTTEDLETMAARISRGGKTPLSWNVYSAYWLLPFAMGFGKPSIADADGGVRPDDAGTKRAISWILSLIDKGYLEPLERDAMVARFASGEIAMILSGSYSIPEFERVGLDFGVAPYPVVASTGKPIAPLLDFKGFAIARSTRSPVTARRLLEQLSGIGVQQRFSASLSKLPANSEAWKLSESANRYSAVLARSAEIGAVIPPSSGYSAYKNTMWKILRFILAGSMKPDAALAEARRLIDANMETENGAAKP